MPQISRRINTISYSTLELFDFWKSSFGFAIPEDFLCNLWTRSARVGSGGGEVGDLDCEDAAGGGLEGDFAERD